MAPRHRGRPFQSIRAVCRLVVRAERGPRSCKVMIIKEKFNMSSADCSGCGPLNGAQTWRWAGSPQPSGHARVAPDRLSEPPHARRRILERLARVVGLGGKALCPLDGVRTPGIEVGEVDTRFSLPPTWPRSLCPICGPVRGPGLSRKCGISHSSKHNPLASDRPQRGLRCPPSNWIASPCVAPWNQCAHLVSLSLDAVAPAARAPVEVHPSRASRCLANRGSPLMPIELLPRTTTEAFVGSQASTSHSGSRSSARAPWHRTTRNRPRTRNEPARPALKRRGEGQRRTRGR